MTDHGKTKAQLIDELAALRQRIAGLEAADVERTQADEALRKSNRAYRILSRGNQAVARATSEIALLQEICQIVTTLGEYRLVWIGYAEQDAAKTVRPVAQMGYEDGYLDAVNITWADVDRGHGPTGMAIRTAQPSLALHIQHDPAFEPWRIEALKRGYQSSVALPMIAGEQVLGALNIYAMKPDAFYEEELDLLMELASNVAFGIMALRMQAERKQLLATLGRRNIQLQAAAEVSQAANQYLDSEVLMRQVVALIQEYFAFYYVGLFLIDENDEHAVLQAGTGEAGLRMLEAGHKLRVGGESMVGACVANAEARIALDVGQEAVRFDNPFLPETRSEMALPLMSRGRCLGALTVQSVEEAAFSDEDIVVLQTMADHLVIAIENAWLYHASQQEIVERLRAEDALIEQHNLLQTLMDTAPDYIFFKDTESRFILSNAALLRSMGKERVEDVVGKTDLELVPHKMAVKFYADEQAVIQTGQPLVNREELSLDQEGREMWALTTKVPLRDKHGQITGLVGITRNISERKQVEEERERLIDELDAFAHTVAHDLKNPLGAITLDAGMLREFFYRLTDEKRETRLQGIIKSAHKMSKIVDALLLLAGVRRMDEVPTEPVNMAGIVDEVQLRLRSVIQETQASVILPAMWPVALGYAPWVEEVWTNYISNALKYGGQPPRIELGAAAQADGMVRFWVHDNGPGLRPEEQAQLFTPFARLSQAQAEGHGLGLSIVQRIVEKLGGEVGVESEQGVGSTFSFTLLGVIA